MIVFLSAIVGAAAWRGRGGWIHLPSTFLARLLGVLPLIIIASAGGWRPALAAALMLPVTFIGWAQWQEQRDSGDLIMMMVRGMMQTFPSGALIAAFGHPTGGAIYMLCGALMGPIYWVAWRVVPVTVRVKIFGNDLIDGPCSVAELLFGTVLYGGLIAVI